MPVPAAVGLEPAWLLQCFGSSWVSWGPHLPHGAWSLLGAKKGRGSQQEGRLAGRQPALEHIQAKTHDCKWSKALLCKLLRAKPLVFHYTILGSGLFACLVWRPWVVFCIFPVFLDCVHFSEALFFLCRMHRKVSDRMLCLSLILSNAFFETYCEQKSSHNPAGFWSIKPIQLHRMEFDFAFLLSWRLGIRWILTSANFLFHILWFARLNLPWLVNGSQTTCFFTLILQK